MLLSYTALLFLLREASTQPHVAFESLTFPAPDRQIWSRMKTCQVTVRVVGKGASSKVLDREPCSILVAINEAVVFAQRVDFLIANDYDALSRAVSLCSSCFDNLLLPSILHVEKGRRGFPSTEVRAYFHRVLEQRPNVFIYNLQTSKRLLKVLQEGGWKDFTLPPQTPTLTSICSGETALLWFASQGFKQFIYYGHDSTATYHPIFGQKRAVKSSGCYNNLRRHARHLMLNITFV